MRRKVLIFYISRYSGHYHAAEAIEKGLLQLDEDMEVHKINTLEYTNPILGKIINRAYLEVIKKKPEFWGNIYDDPNVMEKLKKTRDVFHKFNMSKMKKLLEDDSLCAVFCTQAFPCGMVAEYKRIYGGDISLIGVLTDHAPHSYWLFDEVDAYVVPSAESRDTFVQKGVSSEKIKVYGIPVDPRFGREQDRTRIKEGLSLSEEHPTVLIMGGSQGLGSVGEVVSSLLHDSRHDYQLLVVTGTNKKLYKRLLKLGREVPERNMRIFSYVGNIDELMEASDIIVTKAGGLTTAEALVKNLPIIIVNPIPGHEGMNADYLVKKGAAIDAGGFENIHSTINEIFDSKNTLKRMEESVRGLSKPDSALDVAKLALEVD